MWNSTADGGVSICVKTLMVAVGVGVLVGGCAGWDTSGSSGPSSGGGHRGCVSSRALGTSVGVGSRAVRVAVGRVVTVWLTEPEAYASSSDGAPPPTAFPWLTPQSSDAAALSPAPVCKHPPLVTSLPVRLYAFRATSPGRYQLTAALNPAYHVPRMKPPLRPLRRVRVTVIVTARASAEASPATYTTVAPVLHLTRTGTQMACLVMLTSFPPAGCSGVRVAGSLTHVSRTVRFGAMGWQTPPVRLVGTWNGQRLRLTRAPAPAATTRPEPALSAACHVRTAPAGAALARRITGARRRRIDSLEVVPCGGTVWVLVAVADRPTIAFIHEHFGRTVVVSGWLRPEQG
jgi:hypothetical protein